MRDDRLTLEQMLETARRIRSMASGHTRKSFDADDRIVHGYDHVDPDIVWRVATDDVEPVIAALERWSIRLENDFDGRAERGSSSCRTEQGPVLATANMQPHCLSVSSRNLNRSVAPWRDPSSMPESPAPTPRPTQQ